MLSGLIEKLDRPRNYFNSGATRPYPFRKAQLQKLKKAILDHEKELYAAFISDLKKSPEEAWITEIGFVIAEINSALKNLADWMRPEKVDTNLLNFPSSSRIFREPFGVVLIIGPWNYPFQLLLNPLVGAIAAGNCVVLKPSELAPATAAVIRSIIEETFPPEYILFVEAEGGETVSHMMNHFTFDYVFFTGSNRVGKLIYKMAAERLVPVTLELGGKSPCVVEHDANLNVAAKRIAITKFSNAGQMCVAPDFVLVHASVKDKLVQKMKEALINFFGEKPEEDYSYGKIVNEQHFDRLVGFLNEGRLVHGGRYDRKQLFIEPAIVESVPDGSPLLREEIFGPILPVIPFSSMDEALAVINKNPNPLSFYIYTSSSSKEKTWLEAVPAGGSCINNSSWHLTNYNLPFGGRGASGTGHYHGKYSFETFSHKRAVMKTPSWFDPKIKYPPFKGKLKIFKWFT